MRIHTVATLYVLFFSQFFSFTKEMSALLILTVSSVISAEMFNTAIEKLADFCSYEYNPVIRVIKDISAGAVVCCAVFSIIIGLIAFGNIEKIFFIIKFFTQRADKLILFIISLIMSLTYITLGPTGIKKFFYKLKR